MRIILAVSLSLCNFLATAQIRDIPVQQESIHVMEPSDTVTLASNHIAHYPIVISTKAGPEIKKIADELALYLQAISGAKFNVKRNVGKKYGIFIGLHQDFPNYQIHGSFNVNNPAGSQAYEIKSGKREMHIIGATPKALVYAVYDFLGKLGYRQYFPMKKWEIIPQIKTVRFAGYIKEAPDYYHRRVWPGFGVWPAYQASSDRWDQINRNGGYQLKTGHSYDTIVFHNRGAFLKHPEYYALVAGKRKTDDENPKFCISNPALRKLVADYAISKFEKNPLLESFSTDPSDGGGWCECAPCLKIGSPSTRAVLLSNVVAQSVREKFSGKRIGMYAYNQHSPPPEIDVDQDVVVSIATSFIRGGLTLEELISGWKKKKAVLGIRDYHDVYIWSKMLPGKSLASNIGYLKRTIPQFYNQGVRYLSSESSDDWGPGGLGYYLSNKLLWNIKESENTVEIVQDFLKNCFGPSAKTMADFYQILDGTKPKALTTDLVGRMYRLLDQARQQSRTSPDIISRLDDLVLYTRYVELFLKFEVAKVNQAQQAYNEMTTFIAEIEDRRMIHTKAISQGKHWAKLAPEPGKNQTLSWQKPKNFSSIQINSFITNGIQSNNLLDFEPIDFTSQLTPVHFVPGKAYPDGELKPRRGERSYYTWASADLKPIQIKITGGMIAHYRDRGNVKVKLIKIGGASDDGTLETLIQENADTPPDGQPHLVTLQPKQEGLHLVTLNDGNDQTADDWLSHPKIFGSRTKLEGTFYFYVPKGTKRLGLYCNLKSGQLIDPEGRTITIFEEVNGYQSYPVAETASGKVWCIKQVSGEINLLTVPPYFSTIASQLLLPKEIVLKDKL